MAELECSNYNHILISYDIKFDEETLKIKYANVCRRNLRHYEFTTHAAMPVAS